MPDLTTSSAIDTFMGSASNAAALTNLGAVASGGALGTPSSGTLTNCTSIPAGQLTGTVATARLGSGTADATTYLRGDATWATVSGGLANITETLLTASPNNTVNAERLAVTNGTTNVDLVLTPKGTGAFIIGPAPDSTTVGGNKRGNYANDSQRIRTAATQVASGLYSIIGGGYDNISSADRSIVVGGYTNTASAVATFVGGGGLNTASAQHSTIAGGYANAASQQFSTIGGGFAHVASGQYSTIAGGGDNTASGSYSAASGFSAKSELYGKFAHAAGSFAARGDAQLTRLVARIKTTNNTATEMRLDGSTARLTIASGTSTHATIKIIGIKSDGAATAVYMRQVAIKNVAGTTSLVGTVNTLGTDTAAGTSISVTADDTNDALKIDVTGIASETWRWVATIEGVEVAYGA